MIHRLTLAIVLLIPAAASGQIELPSSAELGEPIVARSIDKVPDGYLATYAWRAISKGCHVVRLPGSEEAHVWAHPAGRHEIELVIAMADGKEPPLLRRHTATISITSPTPTPGPTPGPTTDTLADLVTAATAATLGEFHTDWAAAIDAELERATFNTAYKATRTDLALEGTTAAYELIDARLESIEGAGDRLAAELLAIAAEFGDKPEPPGPTPGPRVALIVREAESDTPAIGAELVKLQRGPAADYFQENGHQVLAVDQHLKDGDGNPAPLLEKYKAAITGAGVPCLIIIDPTDGRVLNAARLAAGWTADNVTERIRETGG